MTMVMMMLTMTMTMMMIPVMMMVQVDIKAIVHDAGIPEGIGAMSVLNHYYGRFIILIMMMVM